MIWARSFRTAYWWFAYDVINWDYNKFALNFDTVYKIMQCVSLPKLKFFRSTKIELWAKEVLGFSIVICENGLGILLPTNMAAAIYLYGDFLNFEQL